MSTREHADLREVLQQHEGFLLRFETFNEMKKALGETFGSGAAVIVANMAKPCGQRLCREIVANTERKEEAIERLSELTGEKNWGELSFLDVNFKEGNGRAIVKNSFETREHKPDNQPHCLFLANFLAGFLSELFRKNIVVTEERCIGKGDEFCEFKFR